MDYLKLYNENEEFRQFVDKTMKTYGWTLEETLNVLTVMEVGDYYAKKGEYKNG